MAYTYSKIATYTVGSGGVASIDFLNIPQTYTDLVIKVSARSDQSGVNRSFKIQPNATDTTAIRAGSEQSPVVTYSDTGISFYLPGAGATASIFGNTEIYIPNYTSNVNYKSISTDSVNENNATDAGLMFSAGLYSSGVPITSIRLLINLGVFVQNTSAHLYGIKAEV